ncbi:MAG: primosomal protein N' [Clostridia bacterium]|jgi:primosomal protein N' (replication factor Y) (superfamily II helicase)|nr:primosomal protein N' [Clostridia bacterium]MBT7121421.1 primosomal protein N' [Clostridia bacterium]
MFAKVIVDIAHTSVDKVFEYEIPNDMKLNIGYRVKVPFGRGNKLLEGYVIGISQECGYDGENIKSINFVLSDFATFTPAQIKLAHMIRRYYHTTLATTLRLMFPAQMRGGKVGDKFEREVTYILTDDQYYDFAAALMTSSGKVRAPKQLEVLNTMRENTTMKTRDLEKVVKQSASARDALIKKGALKIESVETLRNPRKVAAIEDDFELTDDQNNAIDAITQIQGKYLLHGVTGSGKTEVYIRIVKHFLALGKSAIVLVPEISLTPQLLAMFERRIGQTIAVYHSTLSSGERYDEWKRMAQGNAKVVIGARSAVFAPLHDVGVIIIDEEHETSYKSDIHPKYTAHEVARMRANIENATLLLASATPSVESYIKAKNNIYHLVTMPQRLFGLKLPAVEIVDMREEIVAGNKTILSGLLYDEMKNVLQNGKQVMLFMNRRGYSTFVMCRGCGFVEYCDSCEVSMTYHESQKTLMCHYCGRKRKLKEICPSCGKKYIKQFGIGTQQVEEFVQQRFPEANVLRMDLDSTRGKDAHVKIYEQFKNAHADILIGTQMIAKGLDFENVALVGVIAADSSLMIPDYRSPEKTFSLLEQVAGRAGRKDPGKVIIQTYSPGHYAIEYARNHDFEGFFNEEMTVRRSALLPPYSVFFRIVFVGKNEDTVYDACTDFESGFEEAFKDIMNQVLLFDAGVAPVKKIQDKTRWQIIIKVLNDGKLADFRKRLYIYSDTKKYSGCTFGLEINPQSMI